VPLVSLNCRLRNRTKDYDNRHNGSSLDVAGLLMSICRVAVVDVGQRGLPITAALAAGLTSDPHFDVTYISTSDRSVWFDSGAADAQSFTWVDLNVPAGRLRLPSTVAKLWFHFACHRYDIILDTGLTLLNYLPRLLRRSARHAVIVHDPAPHPGRRDHVLHRLMSGRFRKADVLVTLSNYCTELLRTQTSANIVESFLGAYSATAVRPAEEIAASRFNLLFWGRLEAYKGTGLLLEAFEQALPQEPRLELRVAGSGDLGPLKARFETLGASVTEGWLTEAELAEFLRWSGIILLPYVSATQSGVAAMAIANGIPCIATDVGALSEQVRNGETGVLVMANDPAAFAQAIVDITRQPLLAEEMAVNSFNRAADSDNWSTIAPKLISDILNAPLRDK
jgi:glycosyltransferase involved in cell wall biosynthesis